MTTPRRSLPVPLHRINEATAFLLELAMLVALGWWGAETGSSPPVSIVRAVAAPLLAAVVWGLFASPKARIRLPLAGVLAVKALAFGCGAAALYEVGWRRLAGAFVAAAFLNTALATFDRRAAMHRERERGD